MSLRARSSSRQAVAPPELRREEPYWVLERRKYRRARLLHLAYALALAGIAIGIAVAVSAAAARPLSAFIGGAV